MTFCNYVGFACIHLSVTELVLYKVKKILTYEIYIYIHIDICLAVCVRPLADHSKAIREPAKPVHI